MVEEVGRRESGAAAEERDHDGPERSFISETEKLELLWRSFFIQSVWNHRGMQNVGFAYALLPLMRRWIRDASARRSFLERHLEFFNTNPAMASYVLGAVGDAEARGESPAVVRDIKKGLSGPLGMTGDALVWGAVRPFAAMVGVALAMRGALWAPIAFLFVYNLPHFAIRAWGVEAGATFGPAAAQQMTADAVRKVIHAVRLLTAFVVGLILALALRGTGPQEAWRYIAGALFFALAVFAVRRRVPAALLACACVGVAVVLMIVGLNGG